MTTITKTYTYPLPDDNFVKGVSGDRVGEWTYEGPDEFVVEVASDGEIYDVDTKVPGPDRVHVTINAETHPEIADCFAHILLMMLVDQRWCSKTLPWTMVMFIST